MSLTHRLTPSEGPRLHCDDVHGVFKGASCHRAQHWLVWLPLSQVGSHISFLFSTTEKQKLTLICVSVISIR